MADQAQPGAAQPNGKPVAKGAATTMTCVILAAVLGCGGVGVIGILAAIAIPNFMKYQCKSMQSEAKTNLRSLYTAQKSFYAEYDYYTSDLVALNWQPYGTPRYIYGFYYPLEDAPANAPSDHDPDRSDTTHDDVVRQGGYQLTKAMTQDGDPLTVDDLPEDSYVERREFVAAAVGDVKSDSFGNLDVWTIDQDGNVSVVEDDCQ